MKSTRSRAALPLRVRRAIEKLGRDLSMARRRRGISHALMAERAFISPSTLVRVERGDAGVSLGILASILFVLDMTDRLAALADPGQDAVGLALDEERLPQRIRSRRSG